MLRNSRGLRGNHKGLKVTPLVHEESRVVDHVRLYGHGTVVVESSRVESSIRQPVNSDVHLLSRTLGRRSRGSPNQFELKRPCVLDRECVQSAHVIDRRRAGIHGQHVQKWS